MNPLSGEDTIEHHSDHKQHPQAFSVELTTRNADLKGAANVRPTRAAASVSVLDSDGEKRDEAHSTSNDKCPGKLGDTVTVTKLHTNRQGTSLSLASNSSAHSLPPSKPPQSQSLGSRIASVLVQYGKFVGPGFLIAVAYIDPGNYATDVGAGAATQYAHLFVILMSNLFAIFLQSLCIKLGSVTGLDLAENCRKHLPKWLTFILYIFAESAIIATDIAEVIGTAIALNLLLKIPLVAGCVISLVDVLLLLLFYNPNGSMKRLRVFEYFVVCLVLGVVICFCLQLTYIRNTTIGEVMKGYIPSPAVINGNGVYLSCGILGATVMPHSIFLGSGVVQPRLRQFDVRSGHIDAMDQVAAAAAADAQDLDSKYRPSIHAIRTCLKYSIVELATSLFTFALFVNSAILIVAGSSLYPGSEATDADLFGIHDLLSRTLSPAAGVLFAIALLLSGTSAGIVCTMAGQMVSEGMIQWKLKPWVRRLMTRAISIIPSVIIAAAVGKEGLNAALTASQVVLSVILPFVTAPLLWFTCRSHIMTVKADNHGPTAEGEATGDVNMRNGWIVTFFAVAIWLVLVIMNTALLVLVGLGKA